MDGELFQRIQKNPRFADLIRRRSRFAWQLSGAMLAIYFAFILAIAFEPGLLGMPIGDGVMTVGIPVGVLIIISAFVLTAIYVRRANGEFDRETRLIIEETR